MKAVVMSIAVLMVVGLLGCSDQSQMTGPVAMSGNSSQVFAKALQELKVDTKVIGPGGYKYAVTGIINYELRNEGETMVLTTDVNLCIASVNTGEEEKVTGGNELVFTKGPGKTDFVSESHAIGSVAETSLRFWIQYSVVNDEVSINDMKIVNGNSQ
jgi:hypothetical protein